MSRPLADLAVDVEDVVDVVVLRRPEEFVQAARWLGRRPTELVVAVRELVAGPDRARQYGKQAKGFVLDRHGLSRFLAERESVLTELATEARS